MPEETITRAQADRLLELCAKVLAEVEHLVDEGRPWRAEVTARLGGIEEQQVPVAAHYAALNKAREEAGAALVQADTKLETERKIADAAAQAVKAEWIQRLSPAKVIALVSAASILLGGGGVASGAAGRLQAAFDALVGNGYDNVTAEPTAPTASPQPPDAPEEGQVEIPHDTLTGGPDAG